ncbi:MAG: hypothetical protein GF350_07620 [Chitinivibrionales bacterium]|nr:hypothetical protein [Chitinivibrionales bacterium]
MNRILYFSIAMLGCMVSLTADELFISGTVTNESGAPIEGASVTATTLFGPTLGGDSTDTQGYYEIQTTLDGNSYVQISAGKSGHQTASEFVNPGNSSDGSPDTIEQDFTLQSSGSSSLNDTVVVTGTVVDSSVGTGLQDCRVVVEAWSTMGGAVIRDSAVSGADGAFVSTPVGESNILYLNWQISKDGYAGEQGTSTVPANDTVDLDTIRLTALASTDSLDYQVSGMITDENDNGVSEAQVIVTVTQDGSVILHDTTQSAAFFSPGTYRSERVRLPYRDEPLTVTVRASESGRYGTETKTISASTENIIVNVQIIDSSSVSTAPVFHLGRPAAGEYLAAFSLNGRRMRMHGSRKQMQGSMGIVILRQGRSNRAKILVKHK